VLLLLLSAALALAVPGSATTTPANGSSLHSYVELATGVLPALLCLIALIAAIGGRLRLSAEALILGFVAAAAAGLIIVFSS
jgi:hypothetical protein